MINNDVLRHLRFAFKMHEPEMVAVFALGDGVVTKAEVTSWLLREEDPGYVLCSDRQLATFLNGLIIAKRGKQEGAAMLAEEVLTNNIVLRKLKIALNLKDDDILTLLLSCDFKMSKHELSALFRKKGHKHFKECKDQLLRNFLKSLGKKPAA